MRERHSVPVLYLLLNYVPNTWALHYYSKCKTRRPASAERTASRQFQATGQPVSRMQASDAMTSQLPRYEAKCVQRRCFQCGSVPLRSDIKGMELPTANILIPLERQLIALQLCRWEFLNNETFQQTFRPPLSKHSMKASMQFINRFLDKVDNILKEIIISWQIKTTSASYVKIQTFTWRHDRSLQNSS